MSQAWMQDLPGFGRCLHIQEAPDFVRVIPLAAVSSWRELLGYQDPVQAVEAIIHVQREGEPDPDPLTGRNPWTDAYTLLAAREQAREERAVLLAPPHEPRPMNLVSQAAQAAYRAVHEPIGGGDCAMDRCRKDARLQLGVPDPGEKCGVASRHVHATLPSAELSALLQGQEPEMLACTQRFLHALTEFDEDPFNPEPDPEPGGGLPTAGDLLDYYREAGDGATDGQGAA